MGDSEVGPHSSVESVFEELRRQLPTIRIERLKVKHPADDDNLWFIKTDGRFEVQIGSHPDGRPPFLIEGDLPDQRRETSQVEEAANLILNWLTSR